MLYRAKIIVGCVDNHLARRVIHEKTESQNYYGTTQVWIDAGNHRDSGQVLIGSSKEPCKPDNTGAYANLPLPGCIFPALLEPEHAVPAVRQAHRPVPEPAEGAEGNYPDLLEEINRLRAENAVLSGAYQFVLLEADGRRRMVRFDLN